MLDLSKFLDYPLWFKMGWIIWVVLSLSLGISSLFLRPEAKSPTESTEKQSSPNSIAELRPYIGVSKIDNEFIDRINNEHGNSLWTVTFQYKNYGTIPAQNLRISIDTPTLTNRNAFPPHDPIVLLPNETKNIQFSMQNYSYTRLILQGLEQLPVNLIFHYQGINNKDYVTKLAFRYNHHAKQFETVSGVVN